ncbi:hypothetical protein [Mucisphaera sp.]|uniref:hypothetical protein n=1 Tax=Mucisphaera sp. TaxID=2913024 RepID=UPI003D0C784B
MKQTAPVSSIRQTAAMLSAWLMAGLGSSAVADNLVVDTDLLTITNTTTSTTWGIGQGLVGASHQNGIATFTFGSDFILGAGDVLTGVGSAPATFLVGNNAIIDSGATIDFSALGTQAGPGGGSGGLGMSGGAGSTGAAGGSGAGVQPLVGGGAFAFFLGFNPPPVPSFPGRDGREGSAATTADPGIAGGSGSSGFGQFGSGGGAGGAAGLPGGSTSFLSGEGGSGGSGGERGISLPFEFISGPLTGNVLKPTDGSVGGEGFDGQNGGAGGTGRGGTNQQNSFNLTGGAGGGGGGGGGGGEGGGGGGGGGGGASGGGAWAIVAVPNPTTPGWSFGGTGGIGGRGGDGGTGGNGGMGADGADGGAGGGAFSIEAQGQVIYQGTGLATGGTGGSGTTGTSGTTGGAGQSGGFFQNGTIGLPGVQTYSIPFTPVIFIGPNFPGQTGADGEIGGAGGDGGTGGRGGHAGGGSGGTIKLVGTTVSGSGSSIDLGGGLGGDSSSSLDDGGQGRFLVGTNAVLPGASAKSVFGGSVTGQDSSTRVGSLSANPFIADAPLVPNLPNLIGGAEAFGLTDLDATLIEVEPGVTLVSQTPANALGGIARYDPSVEGVDTFVGYDLLVLYSARPETLQNPRFGVGQEGFSERLLIGGSANDPLFGGVADQVLPGLESFGVYTTLIPENAEHFYFSFETAGNVYSAQQQILNDGEFIFVTASPDNPVYDAIWTTSSSGNWSDPSQWTVTNNETGLPPGPGELVGWPGFPQNVLGGYAFNVEVGSQTTPVFAQVTQDVTVAIDQLNIANLSSITISPGQSLTIEQFAERSGSGNITNNGTIQLNNATGATGTLRFTGPDIVIEGTGAIASFGGALTSLQGLRSTDRIVQRSGHTLSIDGVLGNNQLLIVNEGTITNAPLLAGATLGELVIDPTGNAMRNTPGLDNSGNILGVAPLTIQDTFLLNRLGGTISGTTINLNDVRLHNDGAFIATNLNINNSEGLIGGTGTYDVTNLSFSLSQIALTIPLRVSGSLSGNNLELYNDSVIGAAGNIDFEDSSFYGGTIEVGAQARFEFSSTFQDVAFVGTDPTGNTSIFITEAASAGQLQFQGIDEVFIDTLILDDDVTMTVDVGSNFNGLTFGEIFGGGDFNLKLTGDTSITYFEFGNVNDDDTLVNLDVGDGIVSMFGSTIDPRGDMDSAVPGFTVKGGIEGDMFLIDGTFDFRQADTTEVFSLDTQDATVLGGEFIQDRIEAFNTTFVNSRLAAGSEMELDGTLRNVTLGDATEIFVGTLRVEGQLGLTPGSFVTFDGGTIVLANDVTIDNGGLQFFGTELTAESAGTRVVLGPNANIFLEGGGFFGTVGSDEIIFENNGFIDLGFDSQLDPFGTGDGGTIGLINRGTITGDSSSAPQLVDATIDNEGGFISGGGSFVWIIGGTVGDFDAEDVVLEDLTITGSVFTNTGSLELIGTITVESQGSIQAGSGNGLFIGAGGVTIEGSGTVSIFDEIFATNAGDRLSIGENITLDLQTDLYSGGGFDLGVTNFGEITTNDLFIEGIQGIVTVPGGSLVANESDPVVAELANIQPGEEENFTGDTTNAFNELQTDTQFVTNFAFVNRGSLFASFVELSGEAMDNRSGYIEGDTLGIDGGVLLNGSDGQGGPDGELVFNSIELTGAQIRGGSIQGNVEIRSGGNTLLEDVSVDILILDTFGDSLILGGHTFVSDLESSSGSIIEVAPLANAELPDLDNNFLTTGLEIVIDHADAQLTIATMNGGLEGIQLTAGRLNVGEFITFDADPSTFTQDGGIFSPGAQADSPANRFAGTARFEGGMGYDLQPGAILLLEIGDAPFLFDRLLIDSDSSANFEGLLQIDLIGSRPAPGTSYQILDIDPAATITGWFDTSLIDTTLWDISLLQSQGIITALQLLGDFNLDGGLSLADLDLLYTAVGGTDLTFDLTSDEIVDTSDITEWLTAILGSSQGDANLDLKVDLIDLSTLASNFGQPATSFGQADFNADGVIDLIDLSTLASNFGFDATAVPEPSALALLALPTVLIRRRANAA